MEILNTMETFLCIPFCLFMEVTASLIAQLAKNPPTMQETPVRFLGWERPLEKG